MSDFITPLAALSPLTGIKSEENPMENFLPGVTTNLPDLPEPLPSATNVPDYLPKDAYQRAVTEVPTEPGAKGKQKRMNDTRYRM